MPKKKKKHELEQTGALAKKITHYHLILLNHLQLAQRCFFILLFRRFVFTFFCFWTEIYLISVARELFNGNLIEKVNELPDNVCLAIFNTLQCFFSRR